ncbi:MAG: thermonuclease family protein [Thermoanaerobaculia bacterium]|nr:thermonuclease family protein [Thermoanaerobaculia bacterium]
MSAIRTIAAVMILATLAACGPSERPKFKIKRASDFEPIMQPAPPPATTTDSAVTESAVSAGTDLTLVEVGGFSGSCDLTFSGINDQDVLALADASGLRGYRLAGIAIPPQTRAEAHAQLRSWLDKEEIGIEIEGSSPGIDRAVYVYRCSAKSMVNAELVRAGLAVVVDGPSLHRDALNRASMEALTAGRGVWGRKK